MKIGVMSDTHGSMYFFEKALRWMKDCQLILHAGDVLYHGYTRKIEGGFSPIHLALAIEEMDNIILARGNCDSYSDEIALGHPLHFVYALIEGEDRKIMLCHGHSHSRTDLIREAQNLGAGILICGHTHIKELSREGGLIVLNPGSTTLPRDDSHSAAIIDDNRIFLIDIHTGETLASMDI